ncbi:MAG: DUF3568 family protein [Burkholderiales bacterium]|nr:DUF3568 family protein [Opitutaceae bacterium]
MKIFPFFRVSLVVTGLALFAGCRSVPLDEAGDMQAVNEVGKFRMVVNADLARTLTATRAAFKEMRLTEISGEVRRFDANLVAETELNEKVRVDILEVNSRQTEVGIRVKWVGHQDYSRRLWERIEAHLASGS